ncbi:PREDICTED: serine protease 52-like isoform X2 [Polistes dominula]|uniref:Serine protease 52-like isoform X2 n=1 Tax=Polistes dominula TaxID=743375 RepID=A0ABM1IDB7_POLDO|nr:PREDICTED: serine protease 52-like isoform X2 [Polistes dominula]
MKTLLTLLGLITLSLAIPRPQGDSLDNLISNVFGRPPSSTTAAQPQNTNGDLDSLIDNVYSRDTVSTSPHTILGTQNQPTKTNNNCECVPYYQCKNGTIVDNGVGIIDIRALDGPCQNYLDVCCTPSNRLVDVTTRSPPIPNPNPNPIPTVRPKCGQRHAKGVGFRIIGDTNNESQFGEFPWMVAILKEESIGPNGKKLNVYQCGGALITTRAVLTAAHCVKGVNPSELRIRAGEWDTQTSNEILPYQDRSVDKIVVHEQFHAGALYNDIAVVILSKPVDIAENVDIVCLPDNSDVYDGSKCLASGWGKDVFGKEGHYQVILKKVELPIVPHDTCQNVLRETRLGKYFILDRTFICAGGEKGKDTCKGDGGSPLVCPLKANPNYYVQTGIVAWGIGCGQDGTPGVYANVAELKHWVDEQIVFNNLDNTVYQYKP